MPKFSSLNLYVTLVSGLDLLKVKIDVCVQFNRTFVPTICVLRTVLAPPPWILRTKKRGVTLICRRHMLSIRLFKNNCKRRQGIWSFLQFAGHKSGTQWRRCDFQDIPGRPGWYHIYARTQSIYRKIIRK